MHFTLFIGFILLFFPIEFNSLYAVYTCTGECIYTVIACTVTWSLYFLYTLYFYNDFIQFLCVQVYKTSLYTPHAISTPYKPLYNSLFLNDK